ncbi:MAG: V4R domain-containing protein [Candidatus Hecatellaceae archaeon]
MAKKKLEFEVDVSEGRVTLEGEDRIIFDLEGFKAVLLGMWEVFGSGAYTILLTAGKHMGKRLAGNLRGKGFESDRAMVEAFVSSVTEAGWGRIVAENLTGKGLTVKVYNFALYRGERSGGRDCAFIKGVISGFFSALWKKVSCSEIRCILDGDECCEFKVERGSV